MIIKEKILQLIKEQLNTKILVTEDSDLKSLGISSLEAMDLIVKLETKTGITIADE
jgi:acyl carrier protein